MAGSTPSRVEETLTVADINIVLWQRGDRQANRAGYNQQQDERNGNETRCDETRFKEHRFHDTCADRKPSHSAILPG